MLHCKISSNLGIIDFYDTQCVYLSKTETFALIDPLQPKRNVYPVRALVGYVDETNVDILKAKGYNVEILD